jgi:hypothetical protein
VITQGNKLPRKIHGTRKSLCIPAAVFLSLDSPTSTSPYSNPPGNCGGRLNAAQAVNKHPAFHDDSFFPARESTGFDRVGNWLHRGGSQARGHLRSEQNSSYEFDHNKTGRLRYIMDTRSLAVLGLRDDGQLNDIVINYYFDMLSIRENENPAYQPRVLFMSTHFSLPGKTRGSTE